MVSTVVDSSFVQPMAPWKLTSPTRAVPSTGPREQFMRLSSFCYRKFEPRHWRTPAAAAIQLELRSEVEQELAVLVLLELARERDVDDEDEVLTRGAELALVSVRLPREETRAMWAAMERAV